MKAKLSLWSLLNETFKPPLSPIGALRISLTSLVLSSSRSVLNLTPNSLVGLVLLIEITPPIVFLPNNVPWGPRRISTDSKSNKSKSVPEFDAAKTPSITVPTVGSNVFSKSSNERPRIEALIPPPPNAISYISTFGASFSRSCTLWIFPLSTCSTLKAVTATGTSWIDSDLLRAVTRISSTPRGAAELAVSCASDCLLVAIKATKAKVKNRIFLFILKLPSLWIFLYYNKAS